jgi:hypothetical protein
VDSIDSIRKLLSTALSVGWQFAKPVCRRFAEEVDRTIITGSGDFEELNRFYQKSAIFFIINSLTGLARPIAENLQENRFAPIMTAYESD